ncbi:MAG: 3D domain-containing protein, partial [Ruminococcus sp.]
NDTGGFAISGSAVVDLFYPTYNQCVQFGRRTVNVYVLA